LWDEKGGHTLKAIVKTHKGKGNVKLMDIPKPIPSPNEVLIEVKAAGICGSDIAIYNDNIKIPLKLPAVIGHEFSGVIVEIGKEVTKFKIGDRVTSETSIVTCGECKYCRAGRYNLCSKRQVLGYAINGAFAKYCVIPQHCLHALPSNVEFVEAAMCEPLACCVHAVIEKTIISAGDTVVVIGPGTIGLLSMQLSLAQGGRVIVCGTSRDQQRLSLAKKLGALATINVQKEDAVSIVKKMTRGYGADVVLECSGSESGIALGLRLVQKGGKYTQIGLPDKSIQVDFDQIVYKEIEIVGSVSQIRASWERALDLLSQRKIQVKPLISHELSMLDWKTGFNLMESKQCVKVILYPVD